MLSIYSQLGMNSNYFLPVVLSSIMFIVFHRYMKNAKITSELFRDRPLSPAQTVEYWTRYVIRHKGGPNLKSSAFNLTWYQYFLLDVFITISLTFSLIMYITYLVLYYGVYKLCVSMVSSVKLKLKSE